MLGTGAVALHCLRLAEDDGMRPAAMSFGRVGFSLRPRRLNSVGVRLYTEHGVVCTSI